MNRIDRLQAIIIHLQSKRVVTAQELAERFDLSIRTIYRDIRALEEAGVPIGSEAGIGYFLSDTYHLPPISFTKEEASALLIGAKFVEQMGDTSTKASNQSALYKIKSVLNSEEKEQLEVLQDTIVVVGQCPTNSCHESTLMADIQSAIVGQRQLSIEYHAFYSNEQSRRVVEPIGIVFYSGTWHMIGYCTLRSDYRDFRIDRIKALEVTSTPYSISRHYNMEEYFEKTHKEYEVYRISLLVREEILTYIHSTKYWYGYTFDEPASDGWRRLHFRNNDLNGFARWVLMSAGDAIIEEPAELNLLVKSFITRLETAYDTNQEHQPTSAYSVKSQEESSHP